MQTSTNICLPRYVGTYLGFVYSAVLGICGNKQPVQHDRGRQGWSHEMFRGYWGYLNFCTLNNMRRAIGLQTGDVKFEI